MTGTAAPFDIAPMTLRRPGICKTVVAPLDTTSAAAAAAASSTSVAVEEGAVKDGDASFGRAHVPYGERGEATYSKLTMGALPECR